MWAVMDLGTNSSRLLIAAYEKKTDEFRVVKRALRITRIGAGMHEQKRQISLKAMHRTLQALADFSCIIKQYPVHKVCLLATQAVREADNRDELREKIKVSFGWELQIISGAEEACLSYWGAVQGLQWLGVPVVIDIGGGSTELICRDEKQNFQVLSLAIGALRLWENPLSDEKIQHLLSRELATIAWPRELVLVGVGGTVTTTAAMWLMLENYEAEKVQGLKLSLSEMMVLYHQLKAMSPQERLQVPGITKGREDIIVPGMQILINIMNYGGETQIIVSDQDLLLGALINNNFLVWSS